jgi:hypothetical protein
MNLQEFFKYVNDGGVFGLFTLILVGGFRKWWTWGWAYSEMEARLRQVEQERDDWRQLALHGTSLAEQTVNLFRSGGRR